MKIQLPDDACSSGYTLTGPFHWEQVFTSLQAGFTGTAQEFVAAGHGYQYAESGPFTRIADAL